MIASLEVLPTIKPLALIASVITGAGSPVDIPDLIAVVSAIFLATLPGGTDCLALPASSKTGVISGSNSVGLVFNFSTAAILVSDVAFLSAASKAASKSSI
jgi:hypothetical protein